MIPSLRNLKEIDTVIGTPKSILPLEHLPLVSVVVANYNYGDFLEQTVLSILKQDYENIEVLVIDGGSTDQSVEILKRLDSDPRVIWVSEPDDGNMPAVNKGLRMAKGQIVGVLHCTDTYEQGAIAHAVKCFEKNKNLTYLGGNSRVIDSRGFTSNRLYGPKIEDSNLSADEICEFRNYPPIMSSFFRTELLLQIGGFFDSCHTNTFCFYFLESFLNGFELKKSSRLMSNYRLHPHDAYESWDQQKLLSYSHQRRWISEKMLSKLGSRLSFQQQRALKTAGHRDELFRRLRRHHQIFRSIPIFIGFLARGGEFKWALTQYISFLYHGLVKIFRLVSLKPKNLSQEKMISDTNWYSSHSAPPTLVTNSVDKPHHARQT